MEESDTVVLNGTEDIIDRRFPGSFLGNSIGGWYFYSTSIGTSSTAFHASQGLTNDKIDNLIFLGWVTEGEHAWIISGEQGTKKGAFSSGYNDIKETTDLYSLIAEHLSNCSDDIVVSKPIERFRSVSSETVKRIKGFASLGDNWDSYGAKAIKWSTMIRAINFFSIIISRFPNAPVPFVAPACSGDIHFEWKMCSKALKHSIPEDENDPFEYLLIDKSSGKVEKTYGRALNTGEMVDIAIDWMR